MMNILIVRIGRVGDMVMCTPALTALLDHYPNAEFTILTSVEGGQMMSQFNPRIKHIWVYHRKFYSSVIRERKIIKSIAQAEFQLIFCFESKQRYYRLFENSSATVYGIRGTDKSIHFSHLLLNVVSRSLNKDVGRYGPFLPSNKTALKETHDILHRHGISRDTILVGLHPTFSGMLNLRKRITRGKHKIWPSLSFAQLADRLHRYGKQKKLDIRVVMNLLPKERAIGEKIASQSQEGMDILTPEPNFIRYVAFIKRLDLLVSPNTGPMHIASAIGTPLIALFSGKAPEDCGPFGQSEFNTVLCAEEMESPLSGISAISVETVFHECKQQINRRVNAKHPSLENKSEAEPTHQLSFNSIHPISF